MTTAVEAGDGAPQTAVPLMTAPVHNATLATEKVTVPPGSPTTAETDALNVDVAPPRERWPVTLVELKGSVTPAAAGTAW